MRENEGVLERRGGGRDVGDGEKEEAGGGFGKGRVVGRVLFWLIAGLKNLVCWWCIFG